MDISIDTIITFIVANLIIILILLLLSYAFTLWMFADALKNRDMMWVALFVLSFFTGVLPGILSSVYYYQVYKPSKKAKDTKEATEQRNPLETDLAPK